MLQSSQSVFLLPSFQNDGKNALITEWLPQVLDIPIFKQTTHEVPQKYLDCFLKISHAYFNHASIRR